MAFAPGLQRIDDRAQALADLGQAIFHPRRHLGIDLADDQPVLLQRAELLGQHALGDAGHPLAQFAEPLRAALQVEEDHTLPLAVDQVERRLDRAAGPMGKIPPFHGGLSNSIQTGTISPNLQYLPFGRYGDIWSMIRKSGYRFSEKIMLKNKARVRSKKAPRRPVGRTSHEGRGLRQIA